MYGVLGMYEVWAMLKHTFILLSFKESSLSVVIFSLSKYITVTPLTHKVIR